MKTELVISNVLRLGVWSSMALIASGSGWHFLSGDSASAARLVTAGLVLLIATPVLRVAASLALFAVERDKIYTLVTAAVLLLLALSFILGKAG
ncbi:MAG: DUF1634 domain-containing protein [Verrucomicrobiales bacterium]|jgi:uncharacterized membrane protein|nr:DUF1634 domain-containing protein [Verrucomicrobiales bacterium]